MILQCYAMGTGKLTEKLLEVCKSKREVVIILFWQQTGSTLKIIAELALY